MNPFAHAIASSIVTVEVSARSRTQAAGERSGGRDGGAAGVEHLAFLERRHGRPVDVKGRGQSEGSRRETGVEHLSRLLGAADG